MRKYALFPENWSIVSIEDIADVKGGKRLPKGKALQEEQTIYPYIRVADMYMGGVNLDKILYVPENVYPFISRYTISKDDLFISVAGTLGLVGRIPEELDGANLTENADKLTEIKVNKDFLLQILLSPIIQNAIEREKTSNAQPKLALSRIRSFKIPNPPLAEQQKIADILSTVDAKIYLIDQQISETQSLKKGLMQQLLTGKLSVIENRLLTDAEMKESPLGKIPLGWEIIKVNDISRVIDSLHKTPVFSKNGYPMVRVGDINKAKLNLDNCLKVSNTVYYDFNKNHKPKKGDILMTRVGSYGKTILVDTNSEFCIGQNTVVITDISNPKFLYFMFNSFLIQKQFDRLTNGSSQPSLSLKNIRNLSMVYPPIKEQQKIATILSTVEDKLHILTEKKITYQELKKGLMQQLLTGKIRTST